jgi:radical SAM protein with 4Fe4S-binding SPASM domain
LNDLISELNESITDKDKIDVYSHVLFEDAGFTPIERNEESRAMLYSRQIELNNELGRLGLGRNHRALPFLKTYNCMADTEHATVVYPDGRLFKCEHISIGDEYDDLFHEVTDTSGIEKFQTVTELETCATCPLYPACILLKNCQGLQDKNQYTCMYDVNRAIQSLSAYYLHSKNMKKEPKLASEIVC